jgi:hypothetical protein
VRNWPGAEASPPNLRALEEIRPDAPAQERICFQELPDDIASPWEIEPKWTEIAESNEVRLVR